MDIRRENGEPHATGFGNIGKGAIETALIADDGRHELCRELHPEIRRLKGYTGIGRAVGFAERIPAKAHDHFPGCGYFFPGHTPGCSPCEKAIMIISQLVLTILFGQYLAQAICLGMRKTRDGYRSPGNILLVDHNPEGLVQNVTQQRMNRIPTAPVQTPNILLNELIGSRADDTAVNDQVLEIPHA